MSGFPAFQSNAFQNNAFQTGFMVVAGDYSLGSPTFGTATFQINYQLTVAANYWTGSPSFATPVCGTAFIVLNPISLIVGSPSFSTPFMRSTQRLVAPSYSIGSPVFATALLPQNHHLFANPSAIGSPVFATPRLTHIVPLFASTYDISGLAWYPVDQFHLNHTLQANVYWIYPSYPYPRLSQSIPEGKFIFVPTYYTQVKQADDILRHYLDLLRSSIPSDSETDEANEARRLINKLRNSSSEALRGTTLGQDLRDIHEAVFNAQATYSGVEAARQYLMSQIRTKSLHAQVTLRTCLMMCLGIESEIIVSRIVFKTRDDVQQAIIHVRDIFESARMIGLEEADVLIYQALTALGGAVINHLATVNLQLPRFVQWTTQIPMPALYLANRIYADTKRYEEIITENRVVHPAFCPINLKVLSNAGLKNNFNG